MDAYYNTTWDSADPAVAFHNKVSQPYGLKWHQDLAAAHGKETAVSEWGVKTDNAAEYIHRFADWMAQHDMVYANYWNSDAAGYSGTLHGGRHPEAGAAFLDEFTGSGPDGPAPSTDGPLVLRVSGELSGAAAFHRDRRRPAGRRSRSRLPPTRRGRCRRSSWTFRPRPAGRRSRSGSSTISTEARQGTETYMSTRCDGAARPMPATKPSTARGITRQPTHETRPRTGRVTTAAGLPQLFSEVDIVFHTGLNEAIRPGLSGRTLRGDGSRRRTFRPLFHHQPSGWKGASPLEKAEPRGVVQADRVAGG